MKTIDSVFVKVKGRVQGVGFRYFVYKNAERLGLNGWVKNCMDGSVEILVQGDKNDILTFLEQVKKGNSFTKITEFDYQWIFSEPFTDFRVIR